MPDNYDCLIEGGPAKLNYMPYKGSCRGVKLASRKNVNDFHSFANYPKIKNKLI